MKTQRNTHRLIIAVMMITLAVFGLAACSNAADMAADFPCDYTTKVDQFSTDGYLSDIAANTFPEWYTSWATRFFKGESENRSEWARLILARNGFNDEDQIEPGSTIKIPARCEDLGGDAKPQSSD